jgi:hypothetical protein
LGVVVNVVLATWFALKWISVCLLILLPLVKKSFTIFETTLFAGFAMMLLYTAPHNYAWTWALPMIAIMMNNLRSVLGETSSWNQMWQYSRTQSLTLLGLLLAALPAPIAVPGTSKSILPFLGYATIFVVLCFEIYFFRKSQIEKPVLK